MKHFIYSNHAERRKGYRQINHFAQDFTDSKWYIQEWNSDPFNIQTWVYPTTSHNQSQRTAFRGRGGFSGAPGILQYQLLGQRLNSSFLSKCMSLFRLIAGSSEIKGLALYNYESFGYFFVSANITDNWIRLQIKQKIKTSVLEEMSYILLLNININKEKTLLFI